MKPATPRSPVVLMLLFVASLGFATGCRPPPPSPDTPAVTPSSWTDTAETVLHTLAWAVPAAHAVTDLILHDPGRTAVGRVLDGVADAAGRLRTAVDAYKARGGDRCAAHAAVGGVRAALIAAAQTLTDHGIALGRVLERVTDTVAALVDELVPGCDGDAGWRSAGRDTNTELRTIELRATARGVILRRDLDDLHPPDGGTR